MAIAEQAFNSLPEGENSDFLKKKLLEIAQQQGKRVADIMPANENIVRGNPMLLETQLENIHRNPVYIETKKRLDSMNNEVIPSQYTPDANETPVDVAVLPKEQPPTKADILDALSPDSQKDISVQRIPQATPQGEPVDLKPLGLGISRGVGLLGDVFRGDTENKTQAAITADIDRERAYLRQKLLDDMAAKKFAQQAENDDMELQLKRDALKAKLTKPGKNDKTDNEEFIPGSGYVWTDTDFAKRARNDEPTWRKAIDAYNTSSEALAGIDEFAKNNPPDIIQRALGNLGSPEATAFNAQKQALIGQLRVPLTGPGILTPQEYERLVSVIDNSLNAKNAASSLAAIRRMIKAGLDAKMKGYGISPAGGSLEIKKEVNDFIKNNAPTVTADDKARVKSARDGAK